MCRPAVPCTPVCWCFATCALTHYTWWKIFWSMGCERVYCRLICGSIKACVLARAHVHVCCALSTTCCISKSITYHPTQHKSIASGTIQVTVSVQQPCILVVRGRIRRRILYPKPPGYAGVQAGRGDRAVSAMRSRKYLKQVFDC